MAVPVPTPAPTAPLASAPSVADNLDTAIAAAPDLVHAPSLALDVAQTPGPTGDIAQTVAAAANRQNRANGVDKTAAAIGGNQPHNVVSDIFGWLGHNVLRPVGTAATDALRATNAPLNFVQREYRYLHDVEARHGMLAAIGEGAAIIGVGAAGAIAGGGINLETGMLAAEGATAVLGQVAYHDSWNRVGDPNYVDPNTHQKVSFGRDIAGGLFGLKAGSGAYGTFSGLFDALGDLTADPLANAGRGYAKLYSDQGGQFLGKSSEGTLLQAEKVQPAYDNLPRVRRAIDAMAEAQTPADIRRIDPRYEPIAKDLAAARTPDEVIDVLKSASASLEMLSAKSLPMLTNVRVATSRLRQLAADMEKPSVGTGAVNTVRNVFSPRAWADRFERVPGRSMDPSELNFAGKSIDPTLESGVGAENLRAMARYGMGDAAADHVYNLYMGADTRTRILLVRNTILDSMLGMAGQGLQRNGQTVEEFLKTATFEDPRVQKHIAEYIDHYVTSANPDSANAYGATIFGKPIPNVVDRETGRDLGAAVDTRQAGRIALPNFHDMKRMGQMLQGGKHLFSTLDDFAYNHITQAFFKPLVLQSMGYGFHISFAEMIPNALRQGAFNTIKAHVQVAMAKLSYKADQGDMNAFEGWLWHMRQQISPTSRLMDSKQIQYATEYGVQTHGFGHTVGTGAGENIQMESNKVDQVVSTTRKGISQVPMKATSSFGMFGPEESPRRVAEWQSWINRISRTPEHQVAASSYMKSLATGATPDQATFDAWKAVSTHLENLPESEKAKWLRLQHTTEHAVPGETPAQDWAHHIVENMKGATHSGSSLTPHGDLIYAVAHGKETKLNRLKQLVQDGEGPLKVPGRKLVADGEGTVQRIANIGFRHLLNPMVNLLSRDSTTMIEYMKIRKSLEPAIEDGRISEDEAATIAVGRATSESIRFIHNIHDRTQWSETLRNWAPFYFAQEQAYRRAGRLLATNPGAFRQYQMEIMGAHNIVSQQQDGQGNQYIALPGSGFLTEGMTAGFSHLGIPVGNVLPAELGGTASSANVIFPLSEGARPGWGPVVLIPAKAVYSKFTELAAKYPVFSPVVTPVAQGIRGAIGDSAITEGMWKEFVPNTTIQRLIEAGMGNDRAFQSSMMQTMASMDYQQNLAMERWVKGGEKGPQPQIIPGAGATFQEKQVFLDRVTNQTRLAYMARAIAGFFSPISANVEIKNYGLSAELTAAITKAGSVLKGMQAFLAANPDATPYTVGESMIPSGGSLPASTEAEQWVTANQKLINQYPAAAVWLMPQLTDTKYNPAVYNEQLAAGLRVKRTPQQFLDQLYVAAGDQTYYSALSQHTAAIQAAAGDKYAQDQEYAKWDAWVQEFGNAHPTWFANHLAGTSQVNSQQSIQQLTAIYAAGQAPVNSQSTLVRQLLDNYHTASADWANAQNSYSYATLEKQVKSQWATYLDGMKTAYPQLAPIITSVFRDVFYARVN